MTISLQRKKLHQTLDTIPDHYLNTVEYYLTHFANTQPIISNVALTEEDPKLLVLVEKIQQTSFHLANITDPTKSWKDYATEVEVKELQNSVIDVTEWNEQWDKIESHMKASSLAHEALERQQD